MIAQLGALSVGGASSLVGWLEVSSPERYLASNPYMIYLDVAKA